MLDGPPRHAVRLDAFAQRGRGGGAWLFGALLRLKRPDRITLLFSGAQKSIAVGAPLAATLFPPAIAGMVLVPILVYHMAQLILSAWIAPALRAKQGVVLE